MSQIRLDFIGDIKELLPELKKLIEEQEKLQDASGKTGKEIKNQFGAASPILDSVQQKIRGVLDQMGPLGKVAENLGGKLKAGFGVGEKAAFSFGTALKAIPILGIIAAIVSLVAYFKSTEEGAERLERIMAALGAAFEVIIGRVAQVGEGLIKIFVDGDISGGIAEIGDSFNGVADEIQEATNNAIAFTRALQEVEDQNKKLDVQAAIRKNTVDLLIKQSRDHNKTIDERILLLKNAGAAEKQILDERLRLADIEVQAEELRLKGLIKTHKVSQGNITDELHDALIRRENLRGNSEELQQKIENSISLLVQAEESKRLEAFKKAEAARLALAKDTAERLKKLAEEAAKAEVSSLSGLDKIEEIKRQAHAEITIQEETLKKRGQLTEQAQKNIAIIRNEIDRSSFEATLKFIADENKALKEAGDKRLDIREKISIEEVKLLKNPGLNPAVFEEEKQKIILDIQIRYAKKRLDRLESDNTQEGKLQKLQIQNQIKDLQAELDKVGTGKKSIWEQLGFTGDQQKQAQQSLKTFAQAFQSALNDVAQARVDSADKAIDTIKKQYDDEKALSEERLSRIQTDLENEKGILDTELENRSKGYANDVSGARERVRELNTAKQAEINAQLKAQEQEKIALKKAEAERRRALREQRAVESASQAISIITASANILKGWSTIPFIGQILGAAAIAAMIGAFVASKVRIANSTKNEGFRKGGYTGDGRPTEEAGPVHRKEFVFNEAKTAKHRELFEAIHNDKVNELSLLELLKGTGVTMRPEVPRRFNRLVSESKFYDQRSTMKGIETSVKNIESNTDVLADKAIEKKVEFYPGYRIETFGNIKRRINE